MFYSSDPAIKQYLKHIDETNGLGRKWDLAYTFDAYILPAATSV